MKKLFVILLCSFIAICPSLAGRADETSFDVPAGAAIAIEADTGKILYQKNDSAKMGIASITKIITAYLTLDAIKEGQLKWDDKVKVSDYAYQLTTQSEASNVAMSQDGEYTIRDLFDAAMIQSANSAAIALAEKIGGSEPKFVDLMQKKLKQLGIADAHLVNASGLNNSVLGADNIYPGSTIDDENSMSAKDVAIIAYHLIKDYPEILKVTKQATAVFDQGGPDEQPMHTYNYMLDGYATTRAGVDGLKTGTTDYAGACFVATTTQNGFRIITVVLKADNADSDDYARFTATNGLMNYIYGTWTAKPLVDKGNALDKLKTITVFDGKQKTVKVVASNDAAVVVPVGEDNDKYIKINVDKQPSDHVFAPLTKKDIIAHAYVTIDDGLGYLADTKGEIINLSPKKAVAKANPAKVAWNHFVRFVNEYL